LKEVLVSFGDCSKLWSRIKSSITRLPLRLQSPFFATFIQMEAISAEFKDLLITKAHKLLPPRLSTIGTSDSAMIGTEDTAMIGTEDTAMIGTEDSTMMGAE